MKTKKTKKPDAKARLMAAAAMHKERPPEPGPHAYQSVIDLARGLGLSFNFMAQLDPAELDAGASTDLAIGHAVREFNLKHKREIFWAHPTTHPPGTAPNYYCLWEVVHGKKRSCSAKFLINAPFRILLNRLHAGNLNGPGDGKTMFDNPWDMAVSMAGRGFLSTTATATATGSSLANLAKKWVVSRPDKTVIADFEDIPKLGVVDEKLLAKTLPKKKR